MELAIPTSKARPDGSYTPALQPAPGDLVVDKATGDTFASTPLDSELRALGATRLVIAGLQSAYCIRDTTLGALSLDYEVTLISGGCGSVKRNR